MGMYQGKMKAAARLALLGAYDTCPMFLPVICVLCAILQVLFPALSSGLSPKSLVRSTLRLAFSLCRIRATVRGPLGGCSPPAVCHQPRLN